MEKSNTSNTRGWVLVIGILIIISLAAYLVISVVRQSVMQAQQFVQPVANLSNGIGTQVAQLLRPTPTVIVDPVTIIHQVRSLARLETIQYSVEKVITAESGQGQFSFLFGDRLLLVAHGKVIAGVDLEKLGPENLRVEDNVLFVNLPEPEIFIATLDNEKSYIYDREKGILTSGDVNLETIARQAAEQEIEKAALEDGILELARQNAENYLSRLFRDIGKYSEVIFEQSTPEP
ncbi:MAG TPA: DUF4230 domain-containing protein [Anaerolineales bacterium]|nr:DUF4230 domain-containing protein [Anaerolineales bacterium]